MATTKKNVSLKNCTLDLETMVITENPKKDEVYYHDAKKFLEDLASMNGFNISYDNTTDYEELLSDEQ